MKFFRERRSKYCFGGYSFLIENYRIYFRVKSYSNLIEHFNLYCSCFCFLPPLYLMNALSLDLRLRILKACDKNNATRAQVADRFDVSLGMVKKLLSQRRRIGDIASQRHRCGRKPLIDEDCRNKLRELVESRPDATLQEMRSALGLDCTLVAIHHALIRMGLAYTFEKGRIKVD
jgi:transposase